MEMLKINAHSFYYFIINSDCSALTITVYWGRGSPSPRMGVGEAGEISCDPLEKVF